MDENFLDVELNRALQNFIVHRSKGVDKALFTSTQKPKIFQDSPSHRIFRRMHEVLNIDGNKK